MGKRFHWTLVLLAAAAAGAQAQDAKVKAGEDTYNTYCATCHGDKLVNSGQTFDLRTLRGDEHGRFVESVLKGKNGRMPPWDGVLDKDQIEQLWSYIRANSKVQ
jgi:mono/diheme cytochrome c family protein